MFYHSFLVYPFFEVIGCVFAFRYFIYEKESLRETQKESQNSRHHKLVWILKFRQWFCRPSFETALAPEEIPWRIGGNSSPLFPLVVFILPSDDQGGLNERGEGRALTPLCPMVKDYPQSFFGMKPSKTPHIRFFINNFLVPNQPPKD